MHNEVGGCAEIYPSFLQFFSDRQLGDYFPNQVASTNMSVAMAPKVVASLRVVSRLVWRRKLFLFKKIIWVFAILCISFITVVVITPRYALSSNLTDETGYNQYHNLKHFTVHSMLKNPSSARKSSNDTGVAYVTLYEEREFANKKPNVSATNKRATNRNGTADYCESWCRPKGAKSQTSFFLTAVLLVRIYVKDLAKLRTREMHQWLYYLQYAGFEHVYIYDAFVLKNESQTEALKPFIDEGYVTYIDWSHRAFPYSIEATQHSAYQDCINRFGSQTKWQAAIDIDEYPFSPTDLQPNFARRAVARFSATQPGASELTMQNFLFLGKPLDEEQHPMLIDRIWRRTHHPANNLVKPIYKPSSVGRAVVHHNSLSQGHSLNFPVNQLRLNHYWGARLQNWGDDTPEIIEKTQLDRSMEYIVRILQQCASECLANTDLIYRKQWK